VESVVRAAFVYTLLLVVFRLSGKRTLNEMTTFDFVLLLIISESIQQAMIADDNSVTNGALLVLTLVGMDVLLSLAKHRSRRLERLLDGFPVVIVEDGQVRRDRMVNERVDEADVLAAARELRGLERLDQIKYAVIEQNGRITIVPKGQG
jgi:uncharacterized membrane protein YcaP (DUF421 family)